MATNQNTNEGVNQGPDELGKKIEAIGKLLDLFKYERIMYLSVTIISLLVLLGCALYMLYTRGKDSMPEVIAMFGSSGGIMVTCGRLLKMWSDAIQILSGIQNKA